MTGRKTPANRRTEPILEPLEGRQLLNARVIAPNGKPINDKDLAHAVFQKANNVPLSNRRISYTTPGGSKVQLTLYGSGTLAGTSVRPDGALDLVYNHTTTTSKIVGHVRGPDVSLASIRDADIGARSPSSTGSDPLNVLNLKAFNLIADGYVNLMGGVATLALASAGPNTQIHMTGLTAPASSSSFSAASAANNTTLNTVTTGGVTTIVPSGTVTPTSNAPTTPTGADVSIPKVYGAPRSVPLGNPQIFGFDPKAGALIRFDATTGDPLQSIPVPGGGTSIAGVGLGRNNGHLVAMVGSGANILAFDVISGSLVGQFTTTGPEQQALHTVDGIGSSETRTYISDSSAGTNGLIQSIDVTASLAAGHAVAIGMPFAPQREFELSGGVTGVVGSDIVYTSGAAHFDSAVPDQIQEGILGFTPSILLGTRETSRNAVVNPLTGTDINVGPPGSARAHPTMALGSIGPSLALNTGLFNGQNVITLLTPTTAAATGAVNFKYPNLLAGLSESFHPELLDGSVLDVTGNLRHFVGQEATGLVLNVSGTVNLVQIHTATDTAVVGRPLNHVNIPVRHNVQLISTARGPRGKGTKGGVTVSSTLRPFTQLTLP